MNRRGFLGALFAGAATAAAAPAIVRAASLMKWTPTASGILIHKAHGVGISELMPWEEPGAVIRNAAFVLTGQNIKLAPGVRIHNCRFTLIDPPTGGAAFEATIGGCSVLCDIYVEIKRSSPLDPNFALLRIAHP